MSLRSGGGQNDREFEISQMNITTPPIQGDDGDGWVDLSAPTIKP